MIGCSIAFQDNQLQKSELINVHEITKLSHFQN